MSNLIINDEKMIKVLMKFKIEVSSGPDKIHPRVLKVSTSISKPIYILFNQSLTSMTVPEDWKKALSAISKGGKRKLFM